MNQTQALPKCLKEKTSQAALQHTTDMVGNSKQDNISCTQEPSYTIPGSRKQNAQENFAMALKLFPEFLVEDENEWNQPPGDSTVIKGSSANQKVNDRLPGCETTQDIVRWIKNEFGI